jgi:hypothetical protein
VLEANLAASTGWRETDIGTNYVGILVNELNELRFRCPNHDAAPALEAYAGLKPADYAKRERLEAKLAVFAQARTTNNGTVYVRALAAALQFVGRAWEAVLVLEAYAGLAPGDYSERGRLKAKLAAFGQARTTDIVTGYVCTLAKAQCLGGFAVNAAFVLEAHAGNFAWLSEDGSGPKTAVAADFVSCWLEYCGWGWWELQQGLDVCSRFVRFLQRRVCREGFGIENRKAVVNELRSVRSRVLETGRFWANWATEELDQARASELRLRAALWDAELSQQLLCVRLLFGGVVLAGDEGAESPVNKLPFRKFPAKAIRDYDGHLPRISGPSPKNNCAMAAYGLGAGLDVPSLSPVMAVESEVRSPVIGESVELVRQGLDEARLAAAIGADGLWLQTSIDSEGRILWQALRARNYSVEVAAFGESEQDARLRMSWADALHELEIVLAYCATKKPKKRKQPDPPDPLDLLRKVILGIKHDAAQILLELELESVCMGNALEALLSILEKLRRARAFSHDGIERRLASALDSFVPLVTRPKDPRQLDTWSKIAIEQWRAVLDALESTSKLQKALDADRLLEHLDSVTDQFLRRVEAVWRLGELAELLDESTDLIIQPNDVLHSVPIAHLRVGGKPIFQQVRSVRVSLSILLDTLQRGIEAEAAKAGAANPSRATAKRLLTMSYFSDQDEFCQRGAVILHSGQQILAKGRKYDWLAAGQLPVTTLGLVRRALHKTEIRAATVLGHGHRSRRGVEVAAERAGASTETRYWDGRGQDLSGVELLVIPSCSIGRIESTGELDAEGFCVELAAHRGRTTVACRWPVNAFQAPCFANELVKQYLDAIDDTSVPDSCKRAVAMNRARKTFLGDGAGSATLAHAGLNTIAAFEMYGLG